MKHSSRGLLFSRIRLPLCIFRKTIELSEYERLFFWCLFCATKGVNNLPPLLDYIWKHVQSFSKPRQVVDRMDEIQLQQCPTPGEQPVSVVQ